MDSRERAISRIHTASDAYEEVDPTTLVTDMLSDLLHFCRSHGVNFPERLDMARLHFEEEIGLAFTEESFEPREDGASGSEGDIVRLKILRSHAERCMLRYGPGQSIHTTLKDISELCTAEILIFEELKGDGAEASNADFARERRRPRRESYHQEDAMKTTRRIHQLPGKACPRCKSTGPFLLDSSAHFTLAVDGTLEFPPGEWGLDIDCDCPACGFAARLEDFCEWVAVTGREPAAALRGFRRRRGR